MSTKLPVVEMTPEDRLKAFHVVENIDAFLTRERWLKGGWFASKPAAGGSSFSVTSLYTECLGNFIRRVELGGTNAVKGVNVNNDEEDYAEATSITEYVVMRAIQHEFPVGAVRHIHIDLEKWVELGGDRQWDLIHARDCTMNDGKPCSTCSATRLPNEITMSGTYGPFEGDDPDSVIPDFNDDTGTTYNDVKRVIDTARKIITPPTTIASEVMTDAEARDIALASIEAQLDIDLEKLDAWRDQTQKVGWVINGVKARKLRKRLTKDAELDRENVLRQDCINC